MSSGKRLALGCSALLWAACASSVPASAPRSVPPAADGAGTVEPGDEAERSLLDKLDTLQPGQTLTLNGASASAEAPYAAASGRTCRRVRLGRAGTAPVERLACHDGQRWFYAPEVFATPPVGETAP